MKWETTPERWERRIAKWSPIAACKARKYRRWAITALLSLGLIGWFSDWYRWFGYRFSDPLEREVPVEQWGYEG